VAQDQNGSNTDPDRTLSFEALEEQHFLAGQWQDLARLYARRLAAPALHGSSRERVRLLFRLGQVLEERCDKPEQALERYREAAELDSEFLPALRQLRRLHAARGQWELALQIAELEGERPMRPHERAAFHAELGTLWAEHAQDPGQAIGHFERALEVAPEHDAAEIGRARCLVALDRASEAASTYARVLERLRGPDRAPPLVALAHLQAGPLAEPELAFDSFRRALTEDPRDSDALDALLALARERKQWSIVTDLQERRFELAPDAESRLAVALEAGALELNQLRNPPGARLWYGRAGEIAPDRFEVELALAEVEELAGHRSARWAHLERALELSPDALPARALLETAHAASDRGDLETAVDRAELATTRAPDDHGLLAALADLLARAGREEDRVSVLERRAALVPERSEARARLLLEVGESYETRLDDVEAAADAYRRAFESDATLEASSAGVERTLAKAEAWQELRIHLERACEVVPEPSRARQLCSLGELRAERLDDPEGALRCFEQTLALDPTCERALRGLERVAALQGDEEAVLRAYEREATITLDPERLGFLVGELVPRLEALDRIEEALLWAQRLLSARPDSHAALETCARLQERLGDGVGLAATLARLDAVLAGPARAANRRRLATVHSELHRDETAIEWGLAALALEPDHVPTLEALLAPLERAGRLHELADVYRSLAEHAEASRRGESLEALAGTLAHGLGDLDGALAALRRCRDEAEPPHDLEARIQELLERLGRDEELEALLRERRSGLPATDAEAIAIDLQRARLLLERLQRPDQAAAVLRGVREADPDCAVADEGLETALRASRDLAGLAELLADRAERAPDAAARSRFAFERAVLLEDSLRELQAAQGVYRKLADDDADPDVQDQARQRLEALLERSGDWQALRERLERDLAQAALPKQASLHLRLSRLAGDRLGDRELAVQHLESVCQLDPACIEAWQRLARIYTEDSQTGDLVRVLEGELETGPEPERELALRSRAARLHVENAAPERAEVHFRRLLALCPCHEEAVAFLTARYEDQEQHEALADLLEGRLLALCEATDPEPSTVLSLRLRIAELRSGHLDDPESALASLEPALDEADALAVVATPLAELYERTGRTEALIELCNRAVGHFEAPLERAEWSLRLGHCLCATGREDEARKAYHQALAHRPDDAVACDALCNLYRKSGEIEPLVRLLEARLTRLVGLEETHVRAELAELLADGLGDRQAALLHQRRILELDSSNEVALARALELAEALDRHDAHLDLLEMALERTRAQGSRASLLERKAALLAGPLLRAEDALAVYREALVLKPECARLRGVLRDLLAGLERWQDLIDLVHVEVHRSEGETRTGWLEEGARLAAAHLGPDESLPWLELLRVARPGDAGVLQRMAAIHRQQGRAEAELRAIEAELALSPEPARARTLEVERANLLENALGRPLMAARALEAARRHAPHDASLLERLDEIYAGLSRPRERARVLEALLPLVDAPRRNNLRRSLAWLRAGPLGEPGGAAEVLADALAHPHEGDLPRAELLQSLGRALENAGRIEAAARAAEEELAWLDPTAEVFRERRHELHQRLADAYGGELADPKRELRHLRTLLDTLDPESPRFDAAEAQLLARLRRDRSSVELAERLAERLVRVPGDVAGWLELARLQHECLHRLGEAVDAYRRVLECEPGCLAAWRGLRRAAERLGDPELVAKALEGELEHDASLVGPARSGLLRRLGTVTWTQLASTTRASRAFAEALESDPADLASLRCLELLFEAMQDWRSAISLYESEVETLGDRESERRWLVWLHVAELARERTGEEARELRGFESAAQIAPLEPQAQRRFAEVALARGDKERFADLFSAWCDDDRGSSHASDQLRLGLVLEELGRPEEARDRVERSLDTDPAPSESWDALARLRAATRDLAGSATALEQAAERLPGPDAAGRLIQAAETLAEQDGARALTLLREAVARDPASPAAHAALANQASVLEHWREAARAAAGALDVEARESLSSDLRAATARLGGRAARACNDLELTARLYRALAEQLPEDPEVLARLGETEFALGNPAASLEHLEARAIHAAADPERAEHLALLGRCLEALARDDEALDRFQAALREKPDLADAHAGCARCLESAGRTLEASEALQALARVTDDAASATEILTRAARLALQDPEGLERVEPLLREAVESNPAHTDAWVMLASHLSNNDRMTDALDVATEALGCVPETAESAELAQVRGRALEALGDPTQAALALQEAVRLDPARTQTALACARLHRGLGEWQAAARVLRQVADSALASEHEIASVLHQLGRLLAGPLEDVEGAIDAYEGALGRNPELVEALQALADLLVHRPERFAQAISLHEALLAEQPCRTASLRGLLRLARERGGKDAERTGLSILAALGVATRDERARAQPPLAPPAIEGLDDPLFEAARRLAQGAADEIGLALEASRPSFEGDGQDPEARFRTRTLAAEAELSAAGLMPLPDDQVRNILCLVAGLVADAEAVSGDGHHVNALAEALGRRARRRLRKALGGATPEAIGAMDVAGWRAELRGLAAARALHETQTELRTALLGLLGNDLGRRPAPEEDVSALVEGCPEASALLRRVVRGWIRTLSPER
jgi:tetratricopeptide (TPR) repeat protein